MSLPSPDKAFLILAAVFGLLFVFLTPPFQVPDEPAHAYRIYQISQGGIAAVKQNGTVGGEVPDSLMKDVRDYGLLIDDKESRVMLTDLRTSLGRPLEPGRHQFNDFPNTALYSPVPYLPAVGAFAIGKLAGLSSLALCYLGRLGNFLAWLLLVTLAVRLTPVHKWLFAALALLPMSLFEAASLSADAVTNGLAFLVVALFCRYAFDRTQTVGRREILTLIGVTVLLSLSKNAYFLACGLFLLIPVAKLGSWRRYIAALGLLAGVNLLALAVWAQIGDTAGNLQLLETRMCPSPNTDHFRQLHFILADIPRYLAILARTAVHQADNLSWNFIGVLGWLDTPLHRIFVLGGLGMLVFGGIFENRRDVEIRCRDRLIIGGYAIGTGVLVATMLYMSWTTVGSAEVNGLQGRYFIPIGPAFFLLFYNRSLRLVNQQKYLPRIMAAGMVILLLGATLTLARRYYGRQSFSAMFEKPVPGIVLDPAVPVKLSSIAGFAGLEPLLNVADWRIQADGLVFVAPGDDPQLLLANYTCSDPAMAIRLKAEISVPAATRLQVFYKTRGNRHYSETHSVCLDLAGGRQMVEIRLPAGASGPFRLDSGKIPGRYVIHNVEIGMAPVSHQPKP